MNLGLRCRSIGTAVSVVAYGIGLCRSLGVSAKAAGRYHLSVRCCACKGVTFIAHRSNGRITVSTIRITLMLTCGILLVTVGSIMTCVFCGGIVAVNTSFVSAVLTATVIYPVSISVRAVRCSRRNRHAAIVADFSPFAARVPNGFCGCMVARPHCIQRYTCVCGIAATRLIGCTCRRR